MKEPITSRPRYLKELAEYYGVDPKTLKNWLRRHPKLQAIKPIAGGKYYSITDINVIISELGQTTTD